jgi:3-oxoacyl-[acyl-carrier-protein] synthase II
MKNSRRVVITGLGVVAPNGIGKEPFWQNLIAGKSAVDYITAFDPSPYPCQVAGEIRHFDPTSFMHVRRTKHRGRFSQLAVAAAKLALEDAQIDLRAEPPRRVLACLGNSMNGSGDVYEAARVGFDREGMKGIPMMSGIEFAAHAPVSHVSSELGIRGQGMTLASACATGLDAIQWSADRIRRNEADVVFAGSTEAPISEFCFATLCALGALSKFDDPPLRASRPYDRRRDGLVLGEGAGICVLEELEHAIDRAAPIYAEVLGFGGGNEGGFGNKMNAAELALTEAITCALHAANLRPEDVDYINAHGNSLPDYDLIETRAFRLALGKRAYSVPASSIKSMIGHAMGAASAFQIIASCLTIQHSVLPPTINYEVPDPECDLDYVPNEARTSRVRNVLINAHAMGGTHSVLLLGKPEP